MGVALSITDKAELRTRKITRDKEGHYTEIKGSIHQEVMTVLCVCAYQQRSKYIKQKLIDLKGEIKSQLYWWMSTSFL